MHDSPYRTLIDAPTRAFIAATNAACPADATGLDIAGQRRVYDAMCAVFRQPRIRAAVAVATVEAGLVHGYLRARHTVPRARASFARITATLAAMADGDTR